MLRFARPQVAARRTAELPARTSRASCTTSGRETTRATGGLHAWPSMMQIERRSSRAPLKIMAQPTTGTSARSTKNRNILMCPKRLV